MKITIFAAGSRGDIQPCVALGRALQAAGYQVGLAAPQDFAAFVQAYGLDFHPLRGDVQQVMASATGRQFLGAEGANPLKSIRAIRTLLRPVVMAMAEDAYAACAQADAVISLGVLSAFGHTCAEKLGRPLINLEPAPLLPTRAFAAPAWPWQRDLGGWPNYLSGLAMLQVVWLWYSPFVNAFRRRLGRRPWAAADFRRGLRSTPLLGAYSPSLIPPPADWPASAHVTGYLFLDEPAGWQPPAELSAFLEAGPPPVYVGFGSMAGRDPDQLAGLILEAVARSGQRALLVTGWGGLRPRAIPSDVLVLPAAPHRWLFPRMAAVVHHGGAGTTAEGLRAGVPAVIVPFAFDQAFWGARLTARGLGPAPLPLRQLSVDGLAQALHSAVTDAGLRRRAAACGAVIRAENGLENAVQIVQRYFGRP